MRANPIKNCPGCADTILRATLSVEQQCSSCRKKERNRIWRITNPGVMASNAKRWREAGNVSVRPEGYAEQQRERERRRAPRKIRSRQCSNKSRSGRTT